MGTVALAGTALLALVGCGRLGFDSLANNGDALAAPSDAPPLPAQICELHQFPMAPGLVPAHADLAATATPSTVTIMWADGDAVAGQTPPWGTRIDTTTFSAIVPPMQLAGVAGADELAGIRDLGTTMMIEPVVPGQFAIGQLSESLASPTTPQPITNSVAAREPFIYSNTLDRYVAMYAHGPLFFAPMTSDGTIAAYSSYVPTSGNVGAVACDDGPDHVHVGFRVDPAAGAASCIMGSVYFTSPTVMYLGTNHMLPGACTDIRVAASADATDNVFAVWQIVGGELDADWVDINGTLYPKIVVTSAGRAPRTRYDGTVYRLVWIDSTAGDEFHLGEYPPGGTLSESTLPGWTSAGDNGFTLLRQGNRVWLVILSATELSLLGLCS